MNGYVRRFLGKKIGLFVPIVASRRPRIDWIQDLGELGERPFEVTGMDPDAVEAEVGVVVRLPGGGVTGALVFQVSVHCEGIVDLIYGEVDALAVAIQESG